MRRKEREIIDKEKIRSIIMNCHCCRLGLYDGKEVYIVPMNFGYAEINNKMIFYFHSAKEGRKMDILVDETTISFELDTNYKLNEGEIACQYSARFQSVMGLGVVKQIKDTQEKELAIQCIMKHYTNKKDWVLNETMLNSVSIIQLEVTQLSCKEHL